MRHRAKPGDPASGGILLNYRGWDNRAAEQTVYLSGTSAKVGGWLWRISCPETRQQVPALYLAPDGDRFLSREATGLKYRRAHSKADRALRRGSKLMRKLQTDHGGPEIGKPPGVSHRMFDKLEWRLTKEHVRYLCALLGKTIPNSTTRSRRHHQNFHRGCLAETTLFRISQCTFAIDQAPSR